MNPMFPMNNPMIALVNAAKNGGNPMQMIQQFSAQDPKMRSFMQMVSGKNPQQIRQMAENMARERGTTVDQIRQQLGL